jgi:Tol biopolymer transport system component
MRPESQVRSPDDLSDRMVRTQLEKILASEMFCRSKRLSAFLRFVVEQTLNGDGDSLKEQVLAEEIYGKRIGFSGAEDAIVRNDARRLRDKLREYYAESERDHVIISIPKGTYTPVFERNDSFRVGAVVPIPPSRAGVTARWRRPAVLGAAAGSLALAVSLGIWLANVNQKQPTSWNVAPVTSLPGFEGDPSISPDGEFVAFSWTGSEKPGQSDIYIKAVRGEALRRLTDTPASEVHPAWSPDGRHIAFVRTGQGVFIMSPLGGSERRVSDGRNPAWTPDGRSILTRQGRAAGRPAGIVQVFLDTLERRQLTQPASGEGDWSFAVSPDGKTLAFTRFLRNGVADLYVVPMDGGEPQRRTDWDCAFGGVLWTPDGRDVIYNVGYDYPSSLWRVPARGTRLERGSPILLPMNAHSPSISRPVPGQPARLAFLRVDAAIGLRLIDIEAPRSGAGIETVQPLFDSTLVEYPGSFSRDGTRIAFTSGRTGEHAAGGAPQLWVGRRDNTGLRQLTKLDSPEVRAPSWSPDDRRIVFEASVGGNSDIFVIGAEGGEPRRLTAETSIDQFPTWSKDGSAIYFSSDRTGRQEIWRMGADGGMPMRITWNGGSEPIPSIDGKSVYYLHIAPGSPTKLRQIPIGGTEERVVLENVELSHWAVTEKGIFFLASEPGFDALDLYDTATGKVSRIARLPFRVTVLGDIGRFTVSRDGRWALANQTDRWDADIMMVDKFR